LGGWPERYARSSTRTPRRRPTLVTIDFLIHSRATPSASSTEHEPALDEEHWSYMDGFADGMIARGPTLAADRTTWTGSLHIVDLPGAAAARAFVEREPYNRAGLFDQHLIRRFGNRLGRTMWDAPRGSDDPRFLVIAQPPDEHAPAVPLPDLAAPERERLIVHGELLTLDDARPAGAVLALQAPSRQAVEALLAHAGLGDRFEVQIHDWELGGRR
jgi:uncharacterized protein YciI